MRYTHLVLLLTVMLALAGCPYMSDAPLDEGSYTDTAWLSGKWKEVKPDGRGDIFDLEKTGDGTMLAYEIDSLGKRTEFSRKMVFSKLGNNVYLSVFDEDKEEHTSGYFIYQFRQKSKTELELWPVKEDDNVKSVSALKEQLQKNENNSDMLDVNTVMKFRKL